MHNTYNHMARRKLSLFKRKTERGGKKKKFPPAVTFDLTSAQ
jgi:hypothetical protein